MDESILPPAVLIAAVIAMIVTLYEMGQSLRPASCPECRHCLAISEEAALTQENITREYARRIGLEDKDDDRRID
ncbi:MAG: hypothetical protein M3Q66_08050 [Chloroflexota bacterium]|nr:hypothetical protein [Chloroflexota bacterium]